MRIGICNNTGLVFEGMGAADMVVIGEAPDDEAFAKLSLAMGSAGNIRTTTLKAFSEDAYRKIVEAF